jgi:hypothetical protein
MTIIAIRLEAPGNRALKKGFVLNILRPGGNSIRFSFQLSFYAMDT